MPALVLRLLVVVLAAMLPGSARAADPQPTYVGVDACRKCHEAEYVAWKGSDHDRAMEIADESSVEGSFDGTEFVHGDTRARMFRRDGKYFLHTDGEDGKPADFEVRYTFGVRPLQQYLVSLPGGRLQASVAAWDSRPKEQGGQRWFRLQPDEAMPAGDVMHWTGISQNWNSMCADCHSTDFRKNYSGATKTYDSRWEEIDVACEACHGPGSAHARWAALENRPKKENGGLLVDLRNDGATWAMTATGIASRSIPRTNRGEIETCAPCHSRRSRLVAETPPGQSFLDGYAPALIEPGLYFPNGAIRDEVYVWGSFVQSKMYAAGVTCSDCHEPHGLGVRGGVDGVCQRCHAAETFATKEHHGHANDGAGSRCVDCHMPQRTYMEIDARRDHAFSVPRPDLAKSAGVPNVCATCHEKETEAWAVDKIREWRGGKPSARREFASTLARAWSGDSTVLAELAAIAGDPTWPAIVRASAIAAFPAGASRELRATIAAATGSPDAIVRAAAARASDHLPVPERRLTVGPLLRDPVRVVRVEAGRSLAPLLQQDLPASELADLRGAIGEYRAAQHVHADRPNALTNLGTLAMAEGNAQDAEASFRKAIEVGPYFLPAYVNLADLQRALGREDDAEATLRAGLRVHPDAPELHYALGLSLVRSGRLAEALDELRTAALAVPDEVQFSYVYGVALHSAGKSRQAIDVLQAALLKAPRDESILEALGGIYKDLGENDNAVAALRVLQALRAARMRSNAPEQPASGDQR